MGFPRSPYIPLSLFLLCPIWATLANIAADSLTPSLVEAESRALLDSTTHSLTGVLLTLGIFSFKWRLLLLAYVLSAFIDIDHFICAGSLSLSRATRLDGRPFLHDTLTAVAVCALLAVFFQLHSRAQNAKSQIIAQKGGALISPVERFAYMPFVVTVAVSLLAHHTRDALRRGFWLRGLFSTRAISYCEMNVVFTFMVVFGKILSLLKSNSFSNFSFASLRTRSTVYVV